MYAIPYVLILNEVVLQNALDLLGPCNVSVDVHDQAWAEQQGMNAFLSVARGSKEIPLFLEITYNNAPDQAKPIAIVGKKI